MGKSLNDVIHRKRWEKTIKLGDTWVGVEKIGLKKGDSRETVGKKLKTEGKCEKYVSTRGHLRNGGRICFNRLSLGRR